MPIRQLDYEGDASFSPYQTSPQGPSPSPYGAGAYGAIPQLPAYTTDTTSQLGTNVQAQMLQNLPGYAAMSAADSSNIAGNLAGTVSPDVIAQMQQGAAERGISTGTQGSASNNAAYLKALGLTSMQLQQLGSTQLTAAMGRTPIQQSQTGTQGTDLRAQQAIYNAAPNPTLANQAAMGAIGAGMGAGRGMGGGGGVSPLAPTSALGSMGYQSPYAYNAPATTMAAPASYAAPAPYAGGQLNAPGSVGSYSTGGSNWMLGEGNDEEGMSPEEFDFNNMLG